LNTEFSGGYYAVVTMMNDADSATAYDDAFIRFIGANPETLAHRGTRQVPTSLVNADGSFIQTNRLGEIELYRSYLGFRTNVLHAGDIIETWGKGSFYKGEPEFVDQEGIYADGVEFHVVGHTNMVSASFVPNIATALDDWHKNHYIQFLATRTGASSVVDQQGTKLAVMDVTAYNNFSSLPGANGALLLLTGVPTSENYGMRFRCASAVLASTAGLTSYPPASSVNPVSAYQQSAPVLHLTAQAALQSPNKSTLTPVADAEVASGGATTNYGTSTSMFLQSSTSGYGNERAWVQFNLAGLSIPSGATITNVQLKLFCYKPSAVADLPVEIRGESDGWTETGITWSTQPPLGSVLDTETLTAGVQNQYYSWDVTTFATNELAGDQVASFVAKPVTEDDTITLSYGLDAREYSSGVDAPLLEFDYAVTNTPGAGVANVQFQYQYSPDNSTWTAWSTFSTVTAPPYSLNFSYPNGYGYYQFRSIATGTDGTVEPAPAVADTAVNYVPLTAGPAYYVRPADVKLLIAISDLLTNVTDASGSSIAFLGAGTDGLNLTTTNGTTLATNSTFILYTNSVTPKVNDSFEYTVGDSQGNKAIGTVYIFLNNNVVGQTSTNLIITSTGITANFFGVPGLQYTVERSTNLIQGLGWVSISTNTAPVNGLMQVIDSFKDLGIPVPPGPSAAYYRLRYNP
jgi:hypothetical protein